MQQRQNRRCAELAPQKPREIKRRPSLPTTTTHIKELRRQNCCVLSPAIGDRIAQRLDTQNDSKDLWTQSRGTNMHEADSQMSYEANARQGFRVDIPFHFSSDKSTCRQGLTSIADSCPLLTPEESWSLYEQSYAGPRIARNSGLGDAPSAQGYNSLAAITGKPSFRSSGGDLESKRPRDANGHYQASCKALTAADTLNGSLFPLESSEWFGQPSIEHYSPIFTNDIWYDGQLGLSFQYQHGIACQGAGTAGSFSPQSSAAPLSADSTGNFVCYPSEQSHQHSPGSSFSSPLSNSVTPDITVEPTKLKSTFSEPQPYPGSASAEHAHQQSSPCGNEASELAISETATQIEVNPSGEERPQRRRGKLFAQRSESKDDFLVQWKRSGMSYKEIKVKGHFSEAESTLRGRYRTLTKRKEHRVRKPGWQENDLRLLCDAVRNYTEPAKYMSMEEVLAPKVSWKKVGEYIWKNGGSYHFGNATCKKKWTELQNTRVSRVETRPLPRHLRY